MKKIIQMALSRLILLSTLTLIGFTSFAQFNYVPGTTYTFRTLVSSTQTVQMDIVYDGNDNATVTLTNVAPQSTDKSYSHIFLPTNDEYTFNQTTGSLEVTRNNSFYKNINVTNGTSGDFVVGPKIVPQCNGCQIGSGGCKIAHMDLGRGHWEIYCDWDGTGENACQICHKLSWVEEKSDTHSNDPILVIRVSGNLIIQ